LTFTHDRDIDANRSRSDWKWSIFCGAAVLIAVFLINPVAEMATTDDWSYARTTQLFADSGHFVYNGWGAPMLGWQVIWGALFVKLFGFSFLALRTSTILLGITSAILLHRILLRFGIHPLHAAFGTLIVALCPQFLAETVSFMTDIPGFLCILLCIYGCQRALAASSDRSALLWLCFSAALNIVGGTVRQIVWLGALVLVPSAFWLLRRRRGFPAIGVALWVFSCFCIFLFLRWFQRQPYTVPEGLIDGKIDKDTFKHFLAGLIFIPLDSLIFTLPILVAWLPDLRRLGRISLFILLTCIACVAYALWRRNYLPPWIGDVVTIEGIFRTGPLLGGGPTVLPHWLRISCLVLLFASLSGFLISVKRTIERSRATLEPEVLTWTETLTLLIPFAMAYMALLMPRAAFSIHLLNVFDRYLIPLITIIVILLMRLFSERQGDRLPGICLVTLLFFVFFGVAGTHDLFAANRAILRAIDELVATGVPAVSIDAGWTSDGWNQIVLYGYVNQPRLENPPGAYHPTLGGPLVGCGFGDGSLFPGLHPRYVLVFIPRNCLEPSMFEPVSYKAWLPPNQRTVYIERNPSEP
jgi:hypothetical protein